MAQPPVQNRWLRVVLSLGVVLGLGVPEFGVLAAPLQQPLMGAGLCDGAAVEDQDLIAEAAGAAPMLGLHIK